MGAENSLYVVNKKDLIHYNPEFKRIYFGNEFCERLVPSKQDINYILNFVVKNSLNFSFITPYLSDRFLKRWVEVIKYLRKGDEIVLNDWGYLKALKKSYNYLDFNYSLGRFLLSNISYFNYELQQFISSMGILRVELECFYATSNKLDIIRKTNLKGSFHYPYLFISTTRSCPVASCEKGDIDIDKITSCNKECQKYAFLSKTIKENNNLKLIFKGNSCFAKITKITFDNLPSNIDRFVYLPAVPI
jgi:hypothetical protein